MMQFKRFKNITLKYIYMGDYFIQKQNEKCTYS